MKKNINWFLINENYGGNLCPYAFHFDADYDGFIKTQGKGTDYQAVGFFNGLLRQAYGLEEYNDVARYTFDKLSKDSSYAKRALKNIYKRIEERHGFDKEIFKTDLSTLSDKQLSKLFEKFYWHFYWMSAWSVPFAFTEYGTPLWTNALTAYLNTLKIPEKYTALEIYQILTTHKRKTYTAREKESILKLAILARGYGKLKKIFKQRAERIARKLSLDAPEYYKMVQKHTKEYAWINFGFEGPLLDESYFISVIKDWIKKDPALELRKYRSERNNIYKLQNKLIKQLNIDKQHQYMFWVVREFGFQKTYRKDVEYYSYWAYNTMLRELGKRIGITVKQGHYLLKDEIVDILYGKKRVNTNELNRRIKACFYVVIKGKSKLLVGKEAIQFNKQIRSYTVPKGLKELTGQCACKGEAKARVKIIKNKDDYSKFNTGDILVSYATNPNMVPLMKRASAIITDEGGVTCHAAIVSRELNIPCVIGTRFATQILKDGQKVRVDATRGIVKIL